MTFNRLKPLFVAIAAGATLALDAPRAIAQTESNYACFLIDDAGRVINLEPLCQPPQDVAAERASDADGAEAGYDAFLEAFANAASPESLAVAEVVGDDNVVALGESICEFLGTGANSDDLAIAFSATSLPPIFVNDVSNAATATLCPDFQGI